MRKPWTEIEDSILREEYPNQKSETLADRLGRALCSVYGRANLLGIHKSEEFKNSALSGRMVKGSTKGATTRFQKGDVPFTKGKKQIEYMSDDTIERTKETRFKKGIVPHNTKYDGAISIRRDKSERQYKWIRTGLNDWIHLHRHLWEKHFGFIPDDMCVAFVDFNSMNCEIENLKLITKRENLERNRQRWRFIMELIWSEKREKRKAESEVKFIERQRKKQLSEAEKLQKKLLREAQRLIKQKQVAKDKIKFRVPDYGTIKIKSENPFYSSVEKNWSALFAYSLSLLKNKEAAQDLLHDMISKNTNEGALNFETLKQQTYQCYLEESRVKRRFSTNEHAITYAAVEPEFETESIMTEIMTAFKSLPGTLFNIAQAIYIDELSIDEAVEFLKIGKNDIEAALPGIREQLQNKLTAYRN